jgi:hypothetical protein
LKHCALLRRRPRRGLAKNQLTSGASRLPQRFRRQKLPCAACALPCILDDSGMRRPSKKRAQRSKACAPPSRLLQSDGERGRLLPPGIAWMANSWLVVLPISFDVLYEVHLFVAIRLLFGLAAITWWPGSGGRGVAIAALLATSLLMRNEYGIAAILPAGISGGRELYCARTRGVVLSKVALGYGVPMLGWLLLTTYYYVHRPRYGISSPTPGPSTGKLWRRSLGGRKTGRSCEN